MSPWPRLPCLQESNLFFTALAKVKQYAEKAGHLPVIVSENVQGIRFRRWDVQQVSCEAAKCTHANNCCCRCLRVAFALLTNALTAFCRMPLPVLMFASTLWRLCVA
jgi:hypothetical protein